MATVVPYNPGELVRSGVRSAAMAFGRYGMNRFRRYMSGVRSARRTAFSRSRTRTRTRRRRVSSGRGITNEFDRKLIYRKRRMPRRMRNRWRRFSQKVNAVTEKSLAPITVVLNDRDSHSLNFTLAAENTQQLGAYPLYSCQSGIRTWYNDLYNLLSNYATADDETVKFLFQSAVLDITFQNSSTLNASSINAYAPTLEVDVYEIICNMSLATEGNGAGPIEAFADAASTTPDLPGAAAGIELTSRGCTPWDLPQALSQWKLRILKKTKYLLKPGEVFTYQMRDPRRHVFTKDSILEESAANIPGVTKWILPIWKATPATLGDDTVPDVVGLDVGVTRKYMWKIDSIATKKDAYKAS